MERIIGWMKKNYVWQLKRFTDSPPPLPPSLFTHEVTKVVTPPSNLRDIIYEQPPTVKIHLRKIYKIFIFQKRPKLCIKIYVTNLFIHFKSSYNSWRHAQDININFDIVELFLLVIREIFFELYNNLSVIVWLQYANLMCNFE